jgi:predicted nucleic acid-binding Zn ribbon protein
MVSLVRSGFYVFDTRKGGELETMQEHAIVGELARSGSYVTNCRKGNELLNVKTCANWRRFLLMVHK